MAGFSWMKFVHKIDICSITPERKVFMKAWIYIVNTVASRSKVVLQCWVFQPLRDWHLVSGSLYYVLFTPTLFSVLQKKGLRRKEDHWMVAEHWTSLCFTSDYKSVQGGNVLTFKEDITCTIAFWRNAKAK